MEAADPSISKSRGSDGGRGYGDAHGRHHERGHANGRDRGRVRHRVNGYVYEQGKPQRYFAPGSPALRHSDAGEMVGSLAVAEGRGSWRGIATCFGGPESEGLRRCFHGYGCDYDRDYGRDYGRGCDCGYGSARKHWRHSSVTSSGQKTVANGYD